MKIVAVGYAEFRANDGRLTRVEAKDLDWQAVAADERGMGPATLYQASWEFDDGGSITWEFEEYPVGQANHLNTAVSGGQLLSNITVSIEHEPGD